MEHALAVRLGEGLGHVDAKLQNLVERQRPSGEPGSQCLVLQVLHDVEVDAVLVADVKEGADVGMTEAGDGARLALGAVAPPGRQPVAPEAP